jgi:hypothetical protein
MNKACFAGCDLAKKLSPNGASLAERDDLSSRNVKIKTPYL